MTWERRGDTRDPMIVLIEREERNPTCRQCVWSIGKYDFLGEAICAQNKPMRERCGEWRSLQAYIERSKASSKRSH
jgi:hypothetical protein